jgi:hypothetical protein
MIEVQVDPLAVLAKGAENLGHRMGPWVSFADLMLSTCRECDTLLIFDAREGAMTQKATSPCTHCGFVVPK